MLSFSVLFVLALMATYITRRVVTAKGVVDRPNERSSHSVPTPRGGGIGFVLPFLGACAYWWADSAPLSDPQFIALLGGGVAVAVLGFWDDLCDLSAALRFGLQGLSVLWVLGWTGDLWLYHQFPYPWLGVGFVALAMLWWLNLYNFMDGIDGIAAVEAICVAAGAVLILSLRGEWLPLAPFWLALISCAGGFLVLNWPPAKIFMGDAGSCFLGITLAVLALFSIQAQVISIWAWIILTAVFWVDATITLLRRLIGGQRWHQAHRSHAYQILSRRLHSHLAVTLITTAINALWLIPLAVSVSYLPDFGPQLTIVACLPLLISAYFLGAGRPES